MFQYCIIWVFLVESRKCSAQAIQMTHRALGADLVSAHLHKGEDDPPDGVVAHQGVLAVPGAGIVYK